MEKVLKGWELSGITTFQSGTPFSVVNAGGIQWRFRARQCGRGQRPGFGIVSRTWWVIPKGPSRAGGNNGYSFGPLLMNPGAFAAPAGLTFGDAGRNALNNPSRLNFDIALLKHIKVKEASELELRLETFNTFNHTQFRIYDSNLGNEANNTVSCYGGPTAGYSAAGWRWSKLSHGQRVPASGRCASAAHRAVRGEIFILRDSVRRYLMTDQSVAKGNRMKGTVRAIVCVLIAAAATAPAQAQVFKLLYSFTGQSDGGAPWGPPLLYNGNIFVTTYSGGGPSSAQVGTVFELYTQTNAPYPYYIFAGQPNDGAYPMGGLVAGTRMGISLAPPHKADTSSAAQSSKSPTVRNPCSGISTDRTARIPRAT